MVVDRENMNQGSIAIFIQYGRKRRVVVTLLDRPDGKLLWLAQAADKAQPPPCNSISYALKYWGTIILPSILHNWLAYAAPPSHEPPNWD
jgi:hypothetical protein